MFCSDNSDLLLFTPAPFQRVTANGWSAEVQRAFIANLAKCGVVSAAARSVGRSARSAWRVRGRSGAAGFAEAWDIAVEMARDRAVETSMGRIDGERVAVWYRGKQVGWRTRHDNRLLFAALRAMDGLDGQRLVLARDGEAAGAAPAFAPSLEELIALVGGERPSQDSCAGAQRNC